MIHTVHIKTDIWYETFYLHRNRDKSLILNNIDIYTFKYSYIYIAIKYKFDVTMMAQDGKMYISNRR